jgi:hypothetical protein
VVTLSPLVALACPEPSTIDHDNSLVDSACPAVAVGQAGMTMEFK